jgi:hypothetical protein
MGEEEARLDREFWSSMSAGDRIEAAWQLSEELWQLKGWPTGEQGLHRSVERIIRS